jgi:hypothetical protein
LDDISFNLGTSSIAADPPEGFLFFCPSKEFQIGPSFFKWPECPAYWSLDPFGVKKLSLDDAVNFGFPSLQLSMTVSGSSWDGTIYAGVQQLHQTKGFDPESQDVARHLGCPLYELSGTKNLSFTQSKFPGPN